MVDASQEGAFSRTGRADNDLGVPELHVEAHPVENLIVAVAFSDIFDSEDRSSGFFH
jgi:hypothetical protein